MKPYVLALAVLAAAIILYVVLSLEGNTLKKATTELKVMNDSLSELIFARKSLQDSIEHVTETQVGDRRVQEVLLKIDKIDNEILTVRNRMKILLKEARAYES